MEKLIELHRSKQTLIRNMAVKYSRRSGVPEEEFVSQLNEELWLAWRDYDEGKGATLSTWLNGCLRKRSIDIIREKEGGHYRRFSLINEGNSNDDDDEGAPTSNQIRDEVAEVEPRVINRMYRKKEADQRQLIDFLVNDPVKVDTVTTLIVTEFSKYPSITALAKALGLHHEVVKRKLLALSRKYDANRFGDIRDYLPKDTRIKREFIPA